MMLTEISRSTTSRSLFERANPGLFGLAGHTTSRRGTLERSLALVPISANGGSSFFGHSAVHDLGLHPRLGASLIRMGQTTGDWYQRAKAAIAAFDGLLTRTGSIADSTARNRVLAWVGISSDETSPAYRYATVQSDLSDVDSQSPPRISDYTVERRTNRIEKLEAFNSEFRSKVVNAENVYGTSTTPTPIDRTRILRPVSAAPDLTVPLLIGGGLVAVAVLIAIFK